MRPRSRLKQRGRRRQRRRGNILGEGHWAVVNQGQIHGPHSDEGHDALHGRKRDLTLGLVVKQAPLLLHAPPVHASPRGTIRSQSNFPMWSMFS